VISTVERVLFLKSIDLFREIPGEELVRVAQIADEREFESGARLIVQGEIGDSLYLIVDGRVNVVRDGAVLATLGERECVGELAILDSEPRSAHVDADGPVLALKIEREDFHQLMAEQMPIAIGMIKVLTRRLRETMARRPASRS
jgi:CRP-like cAMP-binding protein